MSLCDSPRPSPLPTALRPEHVDRKRLAQLAINDSGFVFDPVTGLTFNVNPTGLTAVRALKDGVPPQDLPRVIAEAYEADPACDLRSDVEDFLGQLVVHGLIGQRAEAQG